MVLVSCNGSEKNEKILVMESMHTKLSKVAIYSNVFTPSLLFFASYSKSVSDTVIFEFILLKYKQNMYLYIYLSDKVN